MALQPMFGWEFGKYSNATHVEGVRCNMLFQEYPWLERFYHEIEINYDPIPILTSMRNNNYVIPIVAVLLYLTFCYFGQKIMKDRKPFGLNNSLAAWNLFLAVFSMWGAMRTVPHMLWRIATVSFEDTICQSVHSAYGASSVGLAVQLFCLSKIPELVDTVFIVLRKRPLIFLHWYHHVTVLVFCWNACVALASNGLYFVSMNYTVHAVMYFYFFLQSMKMVPKWFPAWTITLMQISQMMIGTYIVGASWYYKTYGGKHYAPGECMVTMDSLYTGGIIYASYLYLFCEFAVKRFIFGDKEMGGGKPKSAKKIE